MSKADKLLQKLLSGKNDSAFTLAELSLVFKQVGFALDRVRGSHFFFRHPDSRALCVPVHGKRIKPVYISQARDLITQK